MNRKRGYVWNMIKKNEDKIKKIWRYEKNSICKNVRGEKMYKVKRKDEWWNK